MGITKGLDKDYFSQHFPYNYHENLFLTTVEIAMKISFSR